MGLATTEVWIIAVVIVVFLFIVGAIIFYLCWRRDASAAGSAVIGESAPLIHPPGPGTSDPHHRGGRGTTAPAVNPHGFCHLEGDALERVLAWLDGVIKYHREPGGIVPIPDSFMPTTSGAALGEPEQHYLDPNGDGAVSPGMTTPRMATPRVSNIDNEETRST